MKIRVVMLDLDGTLLPMDQDEFIKAYFGSIAKKVAPHGYDPDEFVKMIWRGTAAMIKNNGEVLNSDRFWKVFYETFGDRTDDAVPILDDYYENDFDRCVRSSCGYDENAGAAVKAIKDMGYRVVLATNPFFPACATESRMRWAGLDRDDFELYTTYENSRHCKPSLDYYRDLLGTLGVSGEECLMVGNDVDEDMIAEELGMRVFLLPRYIINKSGKDISKYPQGDLCDLVEYVRNL